MPNEPPPTVETAHVSPSVGTPSTCCDTEGAIDYDVTVTMGDRVIEGEVTLIPSPYDGALSSWGTIHNWLSSSLVIAIGDHTDVVVAIEIACRSGEATEVSL